MSRASIVIALVATFLIGASLGLMSGILFTMRQHRMPGEPWMMGGPHTGGPGMMMGGPERHVIRQRMVLPRLREALDLTDEQEARIQPLLDEAHANMGAARDSLRARIDRVLTPGQRERWRHLEEARGFPGEPRGPFGRAHRALPGDEGERK